MRHVLLTVVIVWAALYRPASADELTVVVNRNDDIATLYLRVPADFARPASTQLHGRSLTVADAAGGVTSYYWAKRLAAELFAPVVVRIGEKDVEFEINSAILHPTSDALDFGTPWSASVAASVCSDPNLVLGWPLNTLTLYAGFLTRSVNGAGPVEIALPDHWTGPVTVVVRDFVGGRLEGERRAVIGGGDQIAVTPVSPDRMAQRAALAAVLLGLFTLGFIGWFIVRPWWLLSMAGRNTMIRT